MFWVAKTTRKYSMTIKSVLLLFFTRWLVRTAPNKGALTRDLLVKDEGVLATPPWFPLLVSNENDVD